MTVINGINALLLIATALGFDSPADYDNVTDLNDELAGFSAADIAAELKRGLGNKFPNTTAGKARRNYSRALADAITALGEGDNALELDATQVAFGGDDPDAINLAELLQEIIETPQDNEGGEAPEQTETPEEVDEFANEEDVEDTFVGVVPSTGKTPKTSILHKGVTHSYIKELRVSSQKVQTGPKGKYVWVSMTIATPAGEHTERQPSSFFEGPMKYKNSPMRKALREEAANDEDTKKAFNQFLSLVQNPADVDASFGLLCGTSLGLTAEFGKTEADTSGFWSETTPKFVKAYEAKFGVAPKVRVRKIRGEKKLEVCRFHTGSSELILRRISRIVTADDSFKTTFDKQCASWEELQAAEVAAELEQKKAEQEQQRKLELLSATNDLEATKTAKALAATMEALKAQGIEVNGIDDVVKLQGFVNQAK